MRLAALALLVVGSYALAAQHSPSRPADDLQNMQGTWTIEKFLRDGKPFPEEQRKQMLFVVNGNKMAFKVGDREQAVEFTLDPGQKPPAIDLVDRERELKAVGIYRLEKDTLTILRVEDMPRPKSFDDSTKQGTTLWVFKRKGK